MTTIESALLANVTGGQAADTTPAAPDPDEALAGQFQVDGINAAHCSNLDWAAQKFQNTPGAAQKITAAADKCWSDLRTNMLSGQ